MTTVAFLGLGRMGVLMASHVASWSAENGHDLRVWNRTPGKAGRLAEHEVGSVEEAVDGADRIVLMLFGPDSVREVLPRLAGAPSGALVVDSTTIGPDAAREFAATAAERGLRYVDAPVAGSTGPAREGTLGVLVGGAQADYDDAVELLHLWGAPEKVRRVGEVGSGSALKLCVNQGLGVMAAGVGESLRLGRDLGLDRGVLLDVLGGTAYGWYLGQKRPYLEGSADETTFSLDLMAKDLQLAVDAAQQQLTVTQACLDAARAALADHAGEDYSALTTSVEGS